MLRAGDAGWAVRSVPAATGVHLGGEMGTSPTLWALRCVNAVRLHRRRHHRTSTAAFLMATLVNEVVRAPLRPTSRRAVARLATEGPGIVLRPAPAVDPDAPGWICFSAQDWWYHNRAHSDFQLLQRLARHRPVLLVNSIGLRVPMPGRSTRSARRIARKAASIARLVRRPDPHNPGFHVMTPLSLPLYGTARQRELNARLVRTQVQLVARLLGVTGTDRPDPVLMVTIPTAIDTVEGMASSALVAYRSDKHSGFPEADQRAIEQLEVRCLERADLVFYSAGSLLDAEWDHTGGRARTLDHGVDADHFRRRPVDEIPSDLQSIPHPRIGFFGGLDDYIIDFDLLEQLAATHPGFQLVLIGDATCSMRRFDRYPNVHHLGYRPYSSIPAYGSGFDVALMPWLDNEWIRHSNPIKLKEYLALGLPVVSTDFPEVHRYGHLIRIATSDSEFVDAVERTVHDGGPADPAERRATVEPITWEAAARRLMVETESVLEAGPIPAAPVRRPTPAPPVVSAPTGSTS
jgi:glycosyltransferase involved in cell wall biosynthesis